MSPWYSPFGQHGADVGDVVAADVVVVVVVEVAVDALTLADGNEHRCAAANPGVLANSKYDG
jgi:hypothetical protein